MLLVQILAILIVVGLLLVNRLVPMQEPIKSILNVVVVIVVVLWRLNIFWTFSFALPHPCWNPIIAPDTSSEGRMKSA